MPRTRSGWKGYERTVAAAVGAERIPVTGRAGPAGDPGDIVLPGFYVEVRDRARARPLRWLAEAWTTASRVRLSPLVVFKGPAPHLSPLVVLRWKDFAEVYRRAERAGAAGSPAAGAGGRGPQRAAPGEE